MLKLNLGCGYDLKEGYINIDIRDIVGTAMMDVRQLKYANDSADEIYASDIIEHFSKIEQEPLLKEWHRVLKSGGKLFIRTIDFDRVYMNLFLAHNHELFFTHLYGGQEYEYNYHKWCYTKTTMKAALEKAGFKNINILDGPKESDLVNMIVEAYK
jgi:predicted SAM-dependent methyltransferase